MITTAVCKFCGQVFAAPSGVQTEAEAEDFAINTCRCPDAVEEKERRRHIAEAKKELKEIFSVSFTEPDGEAAETENGILEILNSAIEYMAYSKINSVNMIVPRIGKVTLRADGSSIKIKRSQTFVCESKV